ncbi:MAG TPA: ABC transporter ATP-binding protein, partial [Rhizobiales bacterium]|nr:ABC transporter ATP-binding protein [Hyphomicrobiales bacterium]
MLDKPTSFTKPDKRALSSNRILPLELRGLSLESRGRRLIDRVDLIVEDPGISVIMGPNGAGKSLLLRLMHGLIAPSAGEIRWADTPMNGQMRRRQAMVFQKPVLLRRTATANITHALGLRGIVRSERRSRAYQALQLAGLERHAFTPARVLSGGEQQRLCLARALSLDPEVLFLDEPTTGLDPQGRRSLWEHIERLKAEGRTVLLTTHYMAEAEQLSDRIGIISAGRLIAFGTVAELLARVRALLR